MKHALILTENQNHFLQENRQDPITQDSFSLGDEIVFCASCKSAFLKESWEYMGSEHCNQKNTLYDFPRLATALQIKKVITSAYINPNSDDRSLAFLLDLLVALCFGAGMYFVLSYFRAEKQTISNFSIGTAFLYIIFRDCILGDSSVGKKILGLYFINNQTAKKVYFLTLVIRNLIYWIPMAILITLLLWTENNSVFSLFIVIILLILHIVQALALLTNQFSFFDNLLGIKLMQKNKNAIKK
ncbi:RDD family protein [Bernardetia sp. OM2101]|uniref:RDD family protein n=1 Tax=Bernardetia sp. OM2101 TaxID=3344876 RepID=UPI0035D12D81